MSSNGSDKKLEQLSIWDVLRMSNADGFAPFPKEKLSMGIPVLWLLNNEKVDPPWGKAARITVSG